MLASLRVAPFLRLRRTFDPILRVAILRILSGQRASPIFDHTPPARAEQRAWERGKRLALTVLQ